MDVSPWPPPAGQSLIHGGTGELSVEPPCFTTACSPRRNPSIGILFMQTYIHQACEVRYRVTGHENRGIDFRAFAVSSDLPLVDVLIFAVFIEHIPGVFYSTGERMASGCGVRFRL